MRKPRELSANAFDASEGSPIVSREELAQGIASARERYDDFYVLRAVVQAVPYVGSSIDTLIAGGAAKIQLARIQEFFEQLDARLRDVEVVTDDLDDESLLDLVVSTVDNVTRTRSDSKRARFADLFAHKLESGAPWEDAQAAVRLLADLDDLHIDVLRVALNAPVLGELFEGLQVVCLEPMPTSEVMHAVPLKLGEVLTQYSAPALRMACAELVARGLLHDEGIGRWDIKALNYFVPTDLAQWFKEWVSDL